MRFSLFPKEVKFFDMFLVQNKLMRRAAKHMHKLLRGVDDPGHRIQKIQIIEVRANEMARQIARELASTFITPLDREDIHAINTTQEAVTNAVRALVVRYAAYDVSNSRFPAKRVAKLIRFMTDCTGEALALIAAKKDASEPLERLRALKIECDMILIAGLSEVFDVHAESGQNVLDTLKWSHLYDRLEYVAGKVETLCDILEGIMLKHA